MKKTLTFILFSIFILNINAQGENQKIQFGANFMPFIYWKKNSFLDNSSHIKVQPAKINGVYGGVFAEKYINENWGFKIAINYGQQKSEVQSKLVAKENGVFVINEANMFFQVRSKNTFEYFIIPITTEYALPLDNQNKIWGLVGAGPQLSLFSKFEVIKDGLNEDGSFRNTLGSYNSQNFDSYRKLLIGGTFYTGIKFKISDAFNGFTNIKFDYDFSNASKANWNSYETNPQEYGQLEFSDPTLPYSSVNASKFHNMRLGLEFGVEYDFN
ncbi:Outer membrane protein beta-barrel domain-containing protein [Halpernia humi]|uniref:Outer membrane protein beta-barrel domain-containing protein n=1 Tax=Halpernia humi TaxID=493375 RepID=A0A1H5Y276_9FLAO|nr:outer membrane beta-barrel protein [Halpernia humi]SEG17787.1 Outer membrane protein beta-barrel domain-containing protein [Halpernia humi]